MKNCISRSIYALSLLLLILPLRMAGQSNRLYTIQDGMATCDINTLTLDSRGLLWIGGTSPLCYFGGENFVYTANRDVDTGRTLYTRVWQVEEDKDYCYWLMTDGGLFYFDSRTLTHKRIVLAEGDTDERPYPARSMVNLSNDGRSKLVLTDGYGIFILNADGQEVDAEKTAKVQGLAKESFVTAAVRDHAGDVWLARITRSLFRFNLEDEQEREINMTPEAAGIVAAYRVNKMLEVPERNALYLATDGGILKYDYGTNLLTLVTGDTRIPFTALRRTSDDKLLAGSDSRGLWVLDGHDHLRLSRLHEPFFDLTMAKVKDIVIDKQGNILLALMQKGIYVIPKRSEEFQYTPVSLKGDGRNTSCVTAIELDAEGNYWVGTDGAGVFYADRGDLDNSRPVNEGLNSLLIQRLAVDKHGTVWAGSYGGGIQCHTPGSRGFVTPDWLRWLSSLAVMDFHYDRERDVLYVGTNGMGAYRIDIDKHQFSRLNYHENQSAWITNVYHDPNGTLWIGEVNNVFYVNERTGERGQLEPSIIPGVPICIASFGKGADMRVFVGTSNGMLVYLPATGEWEVVLKGERVMSVNNTDRDVWVATSNTIKAINTRTMSITEFKNFGGFFLGEFHKRSTQKNKMGVLLWGCDNGILSFLPRVMREPHTLQNKVIFTNMVVGGKYVTYNAEQQILDANILSAKQISLPADMNTFSISFCLPDFGESPNTTYEYMLEGVDEGWTATPSTRIQYSKLPPGDYLLRVRACAEEKADEATEGTIAIHVAKPWYATGWACLVYLVLFLLFCSAVWQMLKGRRDRILLLQESRHNAEMKEAKLRLFTSIAHELRTPLMMIVMPLRHLLSTTEDEELRSNLNIMQHNCNRLLDTVRQITDIRKIDAGQFQLHFQEEDICEYCQDIVQSFMGAAEVKHLCLTQENSQPAIPVWIDPVHFEKVLVNILSNAFKFTPEGGTIKICCQKTEKNVEISIFNEGSHISEDDMKRLYERFFQAENGKAHHGSGIGLNLCFELMQLHHGSIEAQNVDQPAGVKFTVCLPLGSAHLSEQELEARPEEQNIAVDSDLMENTQNLAAVTGKLTIDATEEGDTEEAGGKRKARLLIVDDDKDVCEYLMSQLQKDYNITLAFGGNKAWELVMQNRPDLIVTDVMMPDGNGIDLIRRIKGNSELDNIPIIVLTGEDDETLHLRSLQLNVDHYLQKPFNLSILKGAIAQTLSVRENLRRHSTRTDFGYDYDKLKIESAEESLFQRITKTLQAHLDDSEYGVRELSEEVGISRVHLNRKMKERFGVSPNAFIRAYRLKQAAYLLVRNKANISEVAYKVGFNTHSHFSSTFREFFGMSPKDFIAFYTLPENEEALKKLLE